MDEKEKQKLKSWKIVSFTGAVGLVFSLQSIQLGWLHFLGEFAGSWVLLALVLFLVDEGFDNLSEKKYRVLLFIGIMVATLVLFHSLMDKPIRYGEEADQQQLELVEWAFEYGYEAGWDGYGNSAREAYLDLIGDVEDPEEYYAIKDKQIKKAEEEKERAELAKQEAEQAAKAEAVAQAQAAAAEAAANQAEVERPETTSQGTPINYDFDYSSFDMIETPNSTAFSEIGYDEDEMLLVVVFRSSGPYLYYSVPEDVWEGLLNADSMGGYYNRYIKGEYSCDKLA